VGELPPLWRILLLGLEYAQFVYYTVWIRAGYRVLGKNSGWLGTWYWRTAESLHYERREFLYELYYHLSLVDEEPLMDLVAMIRPPRY